MLVEDHDESLAALAAQHALSGEGSPELRRAVAKVGQHRPSLHATIERFFGDAPPSLREGAVHG
jgi:hypothetical protein